MSLTNNEKAGLVVILFIIAVVVSVIIFIDWTGLFDAIKNMLDTPIAELRFRHLLLIILAGTLPFYWSKKK